jgi:hypothetical protein
MAGVGRKSRAIRVHMLLPDVDDVGTTRRAARRFSMLTGGTNTNKIPK